MGRMRTDEEECVISKFVNARLSPPMYKITSVSGSGSCDVDADGLAFDSSEVTVLRYYPTQQVREQN